MIHLHNIDCMEYMATLPDKAFDLAIVDPPYGLGKRLSGGRRTSGFSYDVDWDKMLHQWDAMPPTAEYFRELERVSRNRIIWGANYFTRHLPPSMGWVFWYKKQPDFSFSDGEFAYTSFDCKARIFQLHRGSETGFFGGASTIHPTQKPVALYKWLLKNYAKEGDRILDTHLGSGSIAIACHDMGFDLVGCELDTDYYNAACKRLSNHQKQLTLL